MFHSSLLSNTTNQITFVNNGVDEVRRKASMSIDHTNNGGSYVNLPESTDIDSRNKTQEGRQITLKICLRKPFFFEV